MLDAGKLDSRKESVQRKGYTMADMAETLGHGKVREVVFEK